jgi:chromosomal replication initiator protein
MDATAKFFRAKNYFSTSHPQLVPENNFDAPSIEHRITYMDLEKLWQSVLVEIELQISRANFVTWLKNSKLIDKQDNVAYVAVSNNFAKEWVENKYQKLILGSMRINEPSVTQVKFVVQNTLAPQLTLNKKLMTAAKEPNQMAFPEFKIDPETNLNPRYTFENLVVGSANELVFAAAQSIVKEVGKKYNPFFVYGGVGVGKTHLIQSVGNEIKKLYDNKVKVKYVSSEKFTSDVVWAIRNKRMEDIKKKYRDIDVLLIDDIQFIGGKEKTEEEFFHTFNTLYENNKQIIISSDRPPQNTPILSERLKSRFEGGMIVDVGYPDYEMRVAIIETKLQEKNRQLPKEIIDFISTKLNRSVRELEGILNTIFFYEESKNTPITRDAVDEIIKKNTKKGADSATPNQIIKGVAEFFEIPPQELTGTSRKKEVVEPRQIAMFLLRDIIGMSYQYIGEKTGKRDHTTVIHAYEKISKEINKNPSLQQKINMIKEIIFKK